MASSKSVKVIEVTRVGPFPDSPESAAELTLPFTLFDALWVKHPIVHSVSFYRPTESTRPFFHSDILPKLKSSLSLALVHYRPLAGRIAWDPQEPKPCIRYSPGDAVAFTVAESNADFLRLAGDAQHPASDLHPLVPELSVSHESSSIISIQITLFPGQGFSIGITGNHAVIDGPSGSLFCIAWAHICKQQQQQGQLENEKLISLPSDLIPSFDRTIIKDPNELDVKLLSTWQSFFGNKRSVKPLPSVNADPEVVQATLELTRENIKRLRERVKKESSQETLLRLSNFVITYAYVLTCMVRARGGDVDRLVCFGMPVDYRTRFDPPVPPNYFGNCLGAAFTEAKAGVFMDKTGFLSAVKLVSDLVTGLGLGNLEKMHELVERYTRFDPDTQVMSIDGSTRFPVYELDLGWGNPVKVCGVSLEKNGGIVGVAGNKRGNVDIVVSLKRNEMEIFASLFANSISIRSSL